MFSAYIGMRLPDESPICYSAVLGVIGSASLEDG